MFSACPTSFAKKKQKLNYNGESCLVLEKQFALFETFAKGFRLTAELVEGRSKAEICFSQFTLCRLFKVGRKWKSNILHFDLLCLTAEKVEEWLEIKGHCQTKYAFHAVVCSQHLINLKTDLNIQFLIWCI